jgi:hypothetical protein
VSARPESMTEEEWVQMALDAAVEQGFGVAIEDPATLDFLADVLSHPGNGSAAEEVGDG